MTAVACQWCGYALIGTHRIWLIKDGRLALELDLCARCVDVLLDAIREHDKRGHESGFALNRPDRRA